MSQSQLDIAATMGTKDQREPDVVVKLKEEEAAERGHDASGLGSEELLDELIASQRRESIIQDQMEQDILEDATTSATNNNKTNSAKKIVAPGGATTTDLDPATSTNANTEGPATDSTGNGNGNGKSAVLVPAMARDIKSDVALPKRPKMLQRSRTKTLLEKESKAKAERELRYSELSHPIEPILSARTDEEMLERFAEKVEQCSMPLDVFLKFNKNGENVRRSALEELVEVCLSVCLYLSV